MNLLIVGGGGYIGCCTALEAKRRGHSVAVVDNFTNSTISSINKVNVDSVVASNAGAYIARDFDAVIYLAALKSVTEGENQAMLYVINNVLELATFMSKNNHLREKPFVFASSAAVYGEPNGVLTTDSPIAPRSIYGMTKAIGEKLVKTLPGHRILRYFNVGGADSVGEEYGKLGNFIPRIFQSKELTLRGGNLDTKDGFPERDYIHVMDVARINIDCAEGLVASGTYNIASGIGTTVKELVELAGVTDYKTEPLQSSEPSRLIGKGDFELKYKVEDIINSSKEWYSHVSKRGVLR